MAPSQCSGVQEVIEMALRGRKAIRQAINSSYRVLGSYDKAGLSWGISGGMVWNFVNEDYYWPKDEMIDRKIMVEASKRGIPLGNRGGRDLWAMSPGELLWRLQNRETIS